MARAKGAARRHVRWNTRREENIVGTTDQPQPLNAGDGPPRMPRWVKVFGIVILVLILLMVLLMATGHHGPSRHMHFGNARDDSSAATDAARP